MICLPVFLLTLVLRFCVQEWKQNAELKARTMSSKAFVVWHADQSGKEKKPTVLALKLNKSLLLPLVGYAEKEPKLIAVDFLVCVLQCVNESWSVPRMKFILHIFWFVQLESVSWGPFR